MSYTNQCYYLWILLAQTRDAVLKARQKELNLENINNRRVATLFFIHALGGETTSGELARLLVRERHSVWELINRMEKQGLVKKVKDLKRKHRINIVLTEEGLAYYKSTKRESIDRIMSSLSNKERKQLWSYLQKIRDSALEEIGMQHEIPFLH